MAPFTGVLVIALTVVLAAVAAGGLVVASDVADAIMLFYDEEEAQRMFEDAGFVDIEHRVLQRRPGSPRAIVTVARAPEA